MVADLKMALPPKAFGGAERLVSYLSMGLGKLGHDVTALANVGSAIPHVRTITMRHEKEVKKFIAKNAKAFDVICDCTHGKLYQNEELQGNYVNFVDTLLLPKFKIGKPNLICISKSHARIIKLEYGLNSVLIYAGLIDPASYRNPITDWSKKSRRFIYVGRIIPEKGPLDAVRFCRRLNIPLDLVQGHGPYNPIESSLISISERFARLGLPVDKLASDIRLDHRAYVLCMLREHRGLGEYFENIPDKPRNHLYSRSMANIFPLHWEEPLGQTPIEAAACGTPTVAYARGAMPEIIEDGVTGFVVKPDDEEAFVDALRNVKELDPKACVANAFQRFSVDKTVQRYLEVFERVLDGERW